MTTSNAPRDKRPLSVTIGSDFGKVGAPAVPSRDVQSQITRLTGAAEQYLKRGQSALAFDSLMEAYLLDPLNPLVVSCEKNVLPAWEAFRNKQTPAAAPAASLTDEQRLARLKAEREAARQEKERKMWEQASRTPGSLSSRQTSPPKQSKPGR